MLLRPDLPSPPVPLPLLSGLWLFRIAGESGYLGPLESSVLPRLAMQRPPCITGALDPEVQYLRWQRSSAFAPLREVVHFLEKLSPAAIGPRGLGT